MTDTPDTAPTNSKLDAADGPTTGAATTRDKLCYNAWTMSRRIERVGVLPLAGRKAKDSKKTAELTGKDALCDRCSRRLSEGALGRFAE
jgi:hypothetical protein